MEELDYLLNSTEDYEGAMLFCTPKLYNKVKKVPLHTKGISVEKTELIYLYMYSKGWTKEQCDNYVCLVPKITVDFTIIE